MATVHTSVETARGCGYAWAAGLFEGEGSVSLMEKKSGRSSIQLSLTSTDRDVVERFCSTVGAGKLYGPYRSQKPGKPQYLWRAHGWDLLARLRLDWEQWLGSRRIQRFDELLALRPPPAPPRRNLMTRKFTTQQIREIRRRLASGESQRSIALAYETDQPRISAIKRGRVYREVV